MQKNPTVHELFDIKGKVFLVAGGGRDLGKDMAVALAEAGAAGVITSRNASLAAATAGEISKATGKNILGLPLNAADENEVDQVFKTIIENFRRIDILVNCVGGGALQQASAKFEESRLEAWEGMHQLNVHTAFLLCKHAVALMKKQGSGVIINIASIAGVVGRDRRVYPEGMNPQSVSYASAKSAVIGFSRDLAAYLGPYGIRVNTISPGGFRRNQPASFIERYSDKVPLGRMGRDGVDLKGAALFLASDASSYVTGHNLVVDGGFSIWQ
ncbi:SDR family oxidoreductase [Agriterribacter sp.]|uniref:SDR family oxidoreductase n=1 Tax=Agriterribacter sp. TaxID=2821509 RepID=UPI002BCBD7D2|nr:SDR family oxidoreductase [Agriterribacter sp.]HRP55917.1 SDR family oxidoreductase [Agriterribacter sp.]